MKFGTQNRSSSLIVEHANYECNTRQRLECSHDNRLRMIIGSEHRTIIRTTVKPAYSGHLRFLKEVSAITRCRLYRVLDFWGKKRQQKLRWMIFFKYSSILRLTEDTMSTKMCVFPLLTMTR